MKRKMEAAFWAVSLQMFLYTTFSNFSSASYSPLSIFIESFYNLSAVELGLITSANFLGALTMFFFVGILVDKLGPNSAIRSAFIIIAIGSMIALFSHTYAEIIIAYFFIGMGYAVITPATNSRIMDHYQENHATPMGIKQAGVPLGVAISTAILPLMALRFSLRYSFLTMLLVSIVFIVLSGSRKKRIVSGSIDFRGYVKDLFASMSKHKLLVAFSLTTAALSWGQQTLLTYYVVFMNSIGYEKYTAEILLILILFGAVFGRLFWMRVGQRLFGQDRVASLALITTISGIMILIFPTLTANIYMSGAIAFLLGMNVVSWNSMYVTAISEMAPREKIGLFSGVSLMYLGMGTIIGTPLAGLVKRQTGSFIDMWLVLGAGILIAALIFAVVIRPIYRSSVSKKKDQQM